MTGRVDDVMVWMLRRLRLLEARSIFGFGSGVSPFVISRE